MQSLPYKSIELMLLFVLFPISLVLDYPLWLKGLIGLVGMGYLLWIFIKIEKISFKPKQSLPWKSFWRRTSVTFLLIAIITTIYVYLKSPEQLFYVPLHKPLLFIAILFVYSVFSVWPQEFIYRTFFFRRYEALFSSKIQLVFINALLFSLAHLFLKNTLVIILTFIGGIIFTMSYFSFKSTLLVTIEHAIYGNWLFTVGMGQMLAFPGMES